MAMEPRPYGRYILEERIAMGGMAEIFRARLTTEGFEKRVCIKRILPHFLEDEDFVTMFRDEARTAAKLQHANCVHVFDFGEVQGTLFLAMELIDGSDLRRILEASRKKRVPLEIGEAVQIGIDVCRGLHHAHTLVENGRPLGVVHRDVSPHNVLVSRAGEVKVTDFGIARAAERATHTSTGMVKGKIAYMAPEQAQGLEFDHRLDQFATGVVLWEMLTGLRLFTGENDAAILKKILACDIAAPSSIRKEVPSILDEVVLKALAAAPEDRYQDMRHFELALSRVLYSGTIDPATADVRNVFPRVIGDGPVDVRKTNVIAGGVLADLPPPPTELEPGTIIPSDPMAKTESQPARPSPPLESAAALSDPGPSVSDVSKVFARSDKSAPSPALHHGAPDALTAVEETETEGLGAEPIPPRAALDPPAASARSARAPAAPSASASKAPAAPSTPALRAPSGSGPLPSLAELERLEESARAEPAPDVTPATRTSIPHQSAPPPPLDGASAPPTASAVALSPPMSSAPDAAPQGRGRLLAAGLVLAGAAALVVGLLVPRLGLPPPGAAGEAGLAPALPAPPSPPAAAEALPAAVSPAAPAPADVGPASAPGVAEEREEAEEPAERAAEKAKKPAAKGQKVDVVVQLSAGWGFLSFGGQKHEVTADGSRIELPVGKPRVRIETAGGKTIWRTLDTQARQHFKIDVD
jgi:eukaryotic-like serine/threonine-protein kinase